MSKIETDFLGNNVKDVDLKEKEIRKFEAIFPSARVIRDHYESEAALERDWKKFVELPYSIKVLANDKCLRYFGKRNPQMYIEMKKKFLTKDIDNKEIDNKYRPANLVEENSAFVNNLAREYIKNNGIILITKDNEDYEALKEQWLKFNIQSQDSKDIANSKSYEYYGESVSDVYKNELKKYLLQEEINEDITANTVSELEIENIRDYLKDNTNLIESAILLDTARKSINTPVEKTIYNEMENRFSKLLNTRGSVYPVLLDSTIGMTEAEVLKSLNTQGKARMLEDSDFIAFQARLLGIDPSRSSANRQDFLGESAFNKLKHGWNPIIKFNSRNCKNANRRMNRIIKENCKFRFIPIYEVDINLQEEFEPKRGISILTIRDLDSNETFDKNNSKVFLTFNPKDPNWYEFRNGAFMVRSNVQSTLDAAKSGMVNVYFVELSDNLYSKAKGIISYFNRSNNIKEVISKLKSSVPNIGNSNLFTMNLLTSIFANRYGSGNDKTSVYSIYSGLNPSSYQDIEDAYQRLNIFTEYKNLTESTFLEDTFKPNILNEVSIDNKDFFNDSEEFISRESIDFNSEYQHIHRILQACKESQDIESMKYYSAKLIYMNKLLENKLYFQENGPLTNLPLLYQTRGNILQEANKTVASILAVEPNFNIEEYYSTTLFETENTEKKKFNFREAFSNLKNMITKSMNVLKL